MSGTDKIAPVPALSAHRYGMKVSASLLFLVLWVLLAILAPSAAKVLLYLFFGAACALVLWRYPVAIIVAMLALAPFYDILRVLFLPDATLVGAWQDLVVIVLAIKGIGLARRPGFRWRFSGLDIAVCVYIAAYGYSVVPSPNLAVWFYGFRWCTLYALFYLVMKTYRFTERQLSRMLTATAVGLIASAAIGYGLLNMLGDVEYSAAWDALGFSAFWREGNFRWPATYPSPITAAISFALLLFIGTAQVVEGKSRKLHVGTAVAGLLACIRTFTRSGWLVAAAGLAAMVWAADKKKPGYRRVTGALAVFAIVGSILLVTFKPQVLDIVSKRDPMDRERLAQFVTVISDAFRYPLGVGVGTAGAVAIVAAQFGGISSGVDPAVGDSVLLQVLRDTGWIGFFALFAVCVGFIRTALKGFRMASNEGSRLITLVSFAFDVGLLVNIMNATDVWPTRFYFWLLGALAVAVVEGRVDSFPIARHET